MYCSPRRAMYGFTLRGPANKLAEAADSPSLSSSFCGMRVITRGRVSNWIGATLSLLALATSGVGRGTFAAAGLTVIGLAIMGLGAGLLGFTFSFEVCGGGLAFGGGRYP